LTFTAVAVFFSSMKTPSVDSPVNWAPIEGLLGAIDCAKFMWMYQLEGLEHYKHIETRRYLRLDKDGKCYVPAEAGWKEVPFEDEWKRVTGRT
jgi:hypothetical protein